jgi:hypothetical protein
MKLASRTGSIKKLVGWYGTYRYQFTLNIRQNNLLEHRGSLAVEKFSTEKYQFWIIRMSRHRKTAPEMGQN